VAPVEHLQLAGSNQGLEPVDVLAVAVAGVALAVADVALCGQEHVVGRFLAVRNRRALRQPEASPNGEPIRSSV
jgi:hypothetical protein